MRDLIQVVKNKVLYIAAHKGFRRYAGNTGWLMGGQMLRMGINLFVAVAVARYLGPADFGLFNYVTAIVALVAVISGLGLQQTAKRDMVEDPERRDEIIGTCFILNTVVSVLCYALMLTVVGVSTQSTELLALFSLLGAVVILQPFNFIEQWFQSQVRARLSVISASIALVLFAALKVAAILLEGSLIAFAYISILEGTVVVLLKIYFYRKHYGQLKLWSYHKKIASRLLHQSWPLIFSGLAAIVYMRTDKVMLGAMSGAEEVGQYSAAVLLSSFFLVIPTLLSSSLFPAIVNSRLVSQELYINRLQRFLDLYALIAWGVVILLSITSGFIILFVFGKDYSEAIEMLRWHVFSLPFAFAGIARNQYLLVERLFKMSMIFTVVGATVNVTANYILIPISGGTGAAIATSFSVFIGSYLTSYFCAKTREIGTMQTRSLFFFLRFNALYKTS